MYPNLCTKDRRLLPACVVPQLQHATREIYEGCQVPGANSLVAAVWRESPLSTNATMCAQVRTVTTSE